MAGHQHLNQRGEPHLVLVTVMVEAEPAPEGVPLGHLPVISRRIKSADVTGGNKHSPGGGKISIHGVGNFTESESGFYSNNSESDHMNLQFQRRISSASSASSNNKVSPQAMPKFCHECGNKYPVPSAKFCCECGMRRIFMNS